jgi:hypothetical protein
MIASANSVQPIPTTVDQIAVRHAGNSKFRMQGSSKIADIIVVQPAGSSPNNTVRALCRMERTQSLITF